MGYTHYWYKPKELDRETFRRFSEDVKKIFDYTQNELQILLDQPEATPDKIWFNGSDDQPAGIWTTSEDVSLPWPDAEAGTAEMSTDPIKEKVSGEWYAGSLLNQRTAPIRENGKGAGSYETFYIERVEPEEMPEWQSNKNEGYFNCCKTAYRPYDITVTAVLIALKHHFGDQVTIKTDGTGKDWIHARTICFNLFGYGMNEELA